MSWVYRRLTSRWRGLPQVYIAGVKKGGTTSLFHYLLKHPRVLSPFRKEVKFYLYMYNHQSVRWYRANFPWASQLQQGYLTVDATPNYAYHPRFVEQVQAVAPDAKIILLLRNPVQRTLSHYFQNRQRNLEPLPLEEALKAEEERLSEEKRRLLEDPCYISWRYHRFGYLAESRYIEYVRPVVENIPSDQLLILRSEDMFHNPAGVLQQVADFLGLESWTFEPKVYKAGRYQLQQEHNSVVAWLYSYFRPYNQRLYELLGRDMGWDA